MIELSSRVQYRTEVLATALENVGQTVNRVKEGYGNMVRGMRSFMPTCRESESPGHQIELPDGSLAADRSRADWGITFSHR